MNTRLQQFLELENLTPARLADMLGIQRSGLSHILSGRNKPSFDFLNRILTKFPHINADWLMTGRGKAYRDPNESVIISGSLPPAGNGAFSQGRPADSGQYNGVGPGGQMYGGSLYGGTQSGSAPFGSPQAGGLPYGSPQAGGSPYGSHPSGSQHPEDSPILDTLDEFFLEATLEGTHSNQTDNTDIEGVTQDSGASQPLENGVKTQTKPSDGKKKRIKRVIVFYNDGSFEELFPHIR